MSRTLAWTDAAWDDYLYWQEQDKKTLKRINELIAETKRSPGTLSNALKQVGLK